MRIAVFIKRTPFHKGYGGLEAQNEALCEGLAQRGHEITVFSPKWSLDKATEAKNGVNHFFVECTYRMFFGFPYLDKNNWVHKSVEAFLTENTKKSFDIVIGQSSAATSLIKKKHELGLKVVSISHGTIISEYKTKVRNVSSLRELVGLVKDSVFVLHNFFFWQRAFVHGSDKVVAVSNAVKRSLIDETFVPEEKIVVIHNGIDPQRFTSESAIKVANAEITSQSLNKNSGESSKKIVITFVGRIIRQKGVFVFVDAIEALLKEVEKNGVKNSILVNFVGDGEDKQKLEQYVKSKNLAEDVKFLGKVPHDEVIKNLQGSDIFVLPSLRVEGFPMVLVEAMFAGLPIIASDIGGVSDAIKNSETGFLVKAGDIVGLKNKILELVRDPELRKTMSGQAKNKAQNHFTLDTMLDKYEQVLHEVLQK